ncbi:MAG: DUF2630 family protein [Candidatus Eremiobacteraeota bacterium]|nr:DUF2630 family protein [Candidatus Eremiobacteraeota bacterium]
MNDQEIHQSIEQLVAEEHALFEQGDRMSEADRKRLKAINVQLDRMWDLLRQRRAREEFKQDPDSAKERSAEVVEKYVE